MLARTYVSIQGPEFDPGAFEKLAGGSARRRKHSGAPLADLPLDYWASDQATGQFTEVGANLLALLSKLAPHAKPLRDIRGMRVYAHIVLELGPGEDPAGLHLPREVTALLGEIGAALDIDAVSRSSTG